MVPAVDVALFCVLVAHGGSLRSSHMASFAVAMALNYLLKVRPRMVASKQSESLRLHAQLLLAALMALFLRGGVLGLLSLHWGWPAQISILFAVLFGLAVTTAGFSYVLSQAEGVSRWRILAIGLIVYAFALRLVYLG